VGLLLAFRFFAGDLDSLILSVRRVFRPSGILMFLVRLVFLAGLFEICLFLTGVFFEVFFMAAFFTVFFGLVFFMADLAFTGVFLGFLANEEDNRLFAGCRLFVFFFGLSFATIKLPCWDY
jgi:hypothetical protein